MISPAFWTWLREEKVGNLLANLEELKRHEDDLTKLIQLPKFHGFEQIHYVPVLVALQMLIKNRAQDTYW